MHTQTIFELLLESGKAITTEVDLEKLVQRVTDIGTEMIEAQFGAFFYNVASREGESLTLYTISGVDREAFAKFPMPRNTKIFEPTFMARGTVRYDDVTAEPHYGQNPPYQGMPKGHLPVRSYLAVPVVAPITREPIGGLFFGHSEAGKFTQDAERLIEGIAMQAAIAMGNARLFEEKKAAEQKLLEQTEQYRSIFNATFDSVIIYDEKGFIVEANPSACRIFGFAYEELLGQHASRLFKNPADFEVLKEIALSGRQYKGHSVRLKKDGTPFGVDYMGYQFLYKGKPHVMSVVKDVTGTQETEDALRKSEQFAQVITNASPVALWMTDQVGQTIYINKTWTDWVGGSEASHLGTGWLQAIVPQDRQRAGDEFTAAFRARKVFTSDFRITRRDGEIRWCATYGSPYYTHDGRFGGFAGSLTDITARKLAEEKLASQNVLINTIANNTQQALFLMDHRQVCTYMNPAAEKMTGFTLDEVKDKPLHYYVHHTHPDGRHFPIEECPIDRALPARAQTEGEEVFIHKDGHFYPVAFTASPIIENGVPIGTVIEARDTTEEKRLQEELRHKEQSVLSTLEQKVQERTAELEKSNYELLQFASVASHDLKEPVRKISIFSNMLRDSNADKLDARSLRQLDNIIASSARMARLIDDLLTYSRLSHTPQEWEEVDLAALVRQTEDDLEIPIKEKRALVHYQDLPMVRGIRLQLGQVFQNLITNSLKFAHPDRRPQISIRAVHMGEGDGQKWRILYEDNGIGFRPEYGEKIFEVFARLHSRDQYEGTGVGLAIVKKIISVHGGDIKAYGKEGEGALFEIILPCHQQGSAAQPAATGYSTVNR